MIYRCPGMPTRKLDSVLVPCPKCGREVEIFSDEPKRRCRCGYVVFREVLPRCADWCPAAAECLAEGLDVAELARRVAENKNNPRARRRVASIRERLKTITDTQGAD